MTNMMRALVKSKAETGLWMEHIPVPDPGPNDVLSGTRVGILNQDLHAAALAALRLSRSECRQEALRRGWDVSADQFFGNIIEAHGGERGARNAA